MALSLFVLLLFVFHVLENQRGILIVCVGSVHWKATSTRQTPVPEPEPAVRAATA
jgi:hypothetical protein